MIGKKLSKDFLKFEVDKTGHNSVVLGFLAGLTLLLLLFCVKKLLEKICCVLMPSQFSSKSSIDDSITLCKKFDIRYEIVSIETLFKSIYRKYER